MVNNFIISNMNSSFEFSKILYFSLVFIADFTGYVSNI